jgi:5'-3' exoribonuclease 2
LPVCYRSLFSDPHSEIIDFYPTEFKLDINGAAYAWMGVNLLPFIDRPRLLRAMNKADQGYTKLSESERNRNQVTGEIVCFYRHDASSKSAMQRYPLAQLKSDLQCTFNQRDPVTGVCKKSEEGLQPGSKVVLITESIATDVVYADKPNAIGSLSFLHPEYSEHKTQLLS